MLVLVYNFFERIAVLLAESADHQASVEGLVRGGMGRREFAAHLQ